MTVSIALRASLAAAVSLLPAAVVVIAFFASFIQIVDGKQELRRFFSAFKASHDRFFPIWFILVPLVILLTPLTSLVLAFVGGALLALAVLAVGWLGRRITRVLSRARSRTHTASRRSARTASSSFLAIAGLMFGIWMSGNANWLPYEAIKSGTHPEFTGRVIGIESDQLVILTSGPTPSIVRFPVESTGRRLCAALNMNEPKGDPNDDGRSVDYGPSLFQIMNEVPRSKLPDCPNRNAP
ncbi:hypothetical protein [Kribbella karoonensis]